MSFEGIGNLSERSRRRTQGPTPRLTFRMSFQPLFLDGLLSSIARLRFTSRTRVPFTAGQLRGSFNNDTRTKQQGAAPS